MYQIFISSHEKHKADKREGKSLVTLGLSHCPQRCVRIRPHLALELPWEVMGKGNKGIIRWVVMIPGTIKCSGCEYCWEAGMGCQFSLLSRATYMLGRDSPTWRSCLLSTVYADGVPGVRGCDVLFKVWKPHGSFLQVEAGSGVDEAWLVPWLVEHFSVPCHLLHSKVTPVISQIRLLPTHPH